MNVLPAVGEPPTEPEVVLPDCSSGKPQTPPSESPTEFVFAVNPGKVLRVLLWLVAGLGAAGAVAGPVCHWLGPNFSGFLAELARRFDLDYDLSFAQVYETTLMFCCSGLLALIAVAAKRNGCRWTFHWGGLALIFLYLGFDHGTNIHELFTVPLRRELGTGGLLYFAWVIPFGLFAATVGLAYLRFLLGLDRRSARLFVLSGSIYLFGVLGMEMVSGALAERHGVDSLHYIAGMTIEQIAQYTGITLFLYALLEHIRTAIGPFRIGWRSGAEAASG